MPVKVQSSGVVGIDAHPIEVEVDVSRGAFGYETVGLPDTAVRESRQRVKAAIRNAGFEFPNERVVVNLGPASALESLTQLASNVDLPKPSSAQSRTTCSSPATRNAAADEITCTPFV